MSKKLKVNTEILAKQVRLIASDGSQLGVMDANEARNIAKEEGLDLVEVAPNSDIPVCKIMDFGRYVFLNKKKKANKTNKKNQIKEVKFTPLTDKADYNFKLKNIKKFLEKHKVKVFIKFIGRQIQHQELGMRMVERLCEDLKEITQVEQEPKLEGRQITAVFGLSKEAKLQMKKQEQIVEAEQINEEEN